MDNQNTCRINSICFAFCVLILVLMDNQNTKKFILCVEFLKVLILVLMDNQNTDSPANEVIRFLS